MVEQIVTALPRSMGNLTVTSKATGIPSDGASNGGAEQAKGALRRTLPVAHVFHWDCESINQEFVQTRRYGRNCGRSSKRHGED